MCKLELIVLGAGQDAGAPQIGNPDDPAWQNPELRQTASSLAIIDHEVKQRFIFDAAPHITEQLQLLDSHAPVDSDGLGIDAVFLTHAHIGHYGGLMFLGREAAGAKTVPVYAMQRMRNYLEQNGPWSQLVELKNIDLQTLSNETPKRITGNLTVVPYQVPHRDEYSETVGYVIQAGEDKILYVPDIDNWGEWDTQYGTSLETIIQSVDYAFIDATFFDDNELPGRDMSQIPHPRVTETMNILDRVEGLDRRNMHFIHYNHTNPIRFENSDESQRVRERGYEIARSGQTICLD